MDSVAPFAVAILGSVPLVLGKTIRNHICESVMTSGTFKGELRSITWTTNWYHDEYLRFFIKTAGGAGVYTDVPVNNVGLHGINLGRGDVGEGDSKWFHNNTKVPESEEITSVYEMRMENWGYHAWLFLVNTERSHYMFNRWLYGRNYKLLWNEAAKDEYAIVHTQEFHKRNKYNVWGHVICKDNVDGRDGIIMYQLWLEKDRNWRIGEGNPKTRHFYYLVWDSTPALRLVHRSNGDKISSVYESSKLRKIPRGFLSGKDLHLFDDELGCVAIIDFGHHLDLYEKFKVKQDLFFPLRYNRVPFEKYFLCPDEFKGHLNKSLDNSRCGKVGRSIDSAGPKGELKFGGIGLLGIGGIILLALLAIAALVLLARKFFAKGSSKDMDSSNGSSKTGGKSSSKKSRSGKSSTGSKKSRLGKSSTGSKSSKTGLRANKSGAK